MDIYHWRFLSIQYHAQGMLQVYGPIVLPWTAPVGVTWIEGPGIHSHQYSSYILALSYARYPPMDLTGICTGIGQGPGQDRYTPMDMLAPLRVYIYTGLEPTVYRG